MKKSVRIFSLVLAVVMLCLSLVSCDLFGKKLSGTYQAEIGLGGLAGYTATYEFKGSKVEITKKATLLGATETSVLNGTYEITEAEDGTMEITITLDSEDEDVKSGTFTFEEGEDYIKIGIVEYTKID